MGLKSKNLISTTPLSWLLRYFTLALNNSAAALELRLLKKLDILA